MYIQYYSVEYDTRYIIRLRSLLSIVLESYYPNYLSTVLNSKPKVQDNSIYSKEQMKFTFLGLIFPSGPGFAKTVIKLHAHFTTNTKKYLNFEINEFLHLTVRDFVI
jgi:hypothetical protein